MWLSFISFPSLIALARTSSTMVNRIGKSGHSCVVLQVRIIAFIVEYDSVWGLHIQLLLWWGSLFVFLLCGIILSWKYVECCKMFFPTSTVYFSLSSINMVYYTDCFVLKYLYLPKINPTCLMLCNSFKILLNSVEDFCINIHKKN